MIKSIRSHIPLTIMFLGVLVRILGYPTSAIRYDEALSLYRATIPFSQFIADHQRYWSLILWELIIRCFVPISKSLWMLRLPSLLLGCASLFIALKIMEQMGFSNFQKIISALIIAFTPGLIWIAQDARPYGLIITLYLLSVFYAIQGKYVGLLGTTGLLMFAHATSPIYAASALLLGIIFHPLKWKKLVIIGITILVCYIPWFALYKNIQPTPGFSDVFWLSDFSIAEFLKSLLLAISVRAINTVEIIIVLITILSVTITMIYLSVQKKLTESVIFLAPFLILLITSLVFENLIFFRTLIPLIIPFTLWYGKSLQFVSRRWMKRSITIAWVTIIAIGLAGWNPSDRGGNVDKIASIINDQWQTGDIIYYSTGTVALPFDYYLPAKPAYLQDGPTRSSLTPPTLHKFQFLPLEQIKHKRAWLIYPIDTFMPYEQTRRIQAYAAQGYKVAEANIFATPDIVVYLVTNTSQ